MKLNGADSNQNRRFLPSKQRPSRFSARYSKLKWCKLDFLISILIFDLPNRFLIRMGKLSGPFQSSTIKCTWNFKIRKLQILNVGFQILNFSFCKSSLALKDANLKIKEIACFHESHFRLDLEIWHAGSNFKIEKTVNKCSFGFHLTFLNQNVICFLCSRGCGIEILNFWEMTFSRLAVLSMEPLCKAHCRKTYPNDCFVIAFSWRNFHELITGSCLLFCVFDFHVGDGANIVLVLELVCWTCFPRMHFSTTNVSIGHVRYFADSTFETKFECEFT